MIDYSFIVCSNGYGHIKRVVSVANALLNQQPNLSIAIIAKPELIGYAKQQSNFNWNQALLTDTTATSYEPDWKQSTTITPEQIKRWTQELANNPTLQQSIHIVSDNHVAPLAAYPNTILMGSFFWHQLHPSYNKQVIEAEDLLLKNHHPKHLCLADMVMPEAILSTKAMGLPWFCSKSDKTRNPSHQVLITGGGTAILNPILLSVVRFLQQQLPAWQVWVDAKLEAYCVSQGFTESKVFAFTEEAFAQLGAIVCRPGIGILTDCIQYDIPAFTIVGESNAEIVHNGNQFELKGLGRNYTLDAQISLEDILIPFLSDTSTLQHIRQNISKVKTGGAFAAAQYLLNIQHDE